MQIKREQLEPTKVKLIISASEADLTVIKEAALKDLGRGLKVPGFRQGKAPAHLLEKHVGESTLQSEFLDRAVNQLYAKAVDREKLKVVAQPLISLTKVVPYTTLEFTAEVDAVGEIKLGDYKKVKLSTRTIDVTAVEVNKVLDNLRERAATKAEAKRPAKMGDELTINFSGTDAKTHEPIDGAEGQDYPLILGSKNFIPGFEEELVGLKTGGSKTFDITFPKDYGVSNLQKRKVTFNVTVTKVVELELPKLDETFVKSLGSFKSLSELKADIKKQVMAEKREEARRAEDNELLEAIAKQTSIDIPRVLVDEEISRIEDEEKRNVAYRGQTWQEHLTSEGVTVEEHKEKQRPGSELRIKVGLILGEIAEMENVTVTPEELEIRIMLLKNQYTDSAMQAELDKPENRRDILGRMLTEKTLDRLRELATTRSSKS